MSGYFRFAYAESLVPGDRRSTQACGRSAATNPVLRELDRLDPVEFLYFA
ncbi:MAG: hypothetical protein WBG36_15660 [Ornithinimicrobium sp.]